MSDRNIGTGWISGTLSIFLGVMALGGVLSFMFPTLLTSPEVRELYPLDAMRNIIAVCLYSGFFFGALCVLLRKYKVLGVIGMTLSLASLLLGGSRVEVGQLINTPVYFALDSFLLSLLYLSFIFVPLELLFPLKKRRVLRENWLTDLKHFFVNHIFIQGILLIAVLPATLFFSWTAATGIHNLISSQPIWLQFLEILIIADFVAYWVHRGFHEIPWLWDFHAVHHSAKQMDWLAGSRLHLVDIIITRGAAFLPVYALGFSLTAMGVYIMYISILAVFIHANIRITFGPLRWIIATPEFHHWHHSDDPKVYDSNYSVHSPILDWIFGTLHFPKGKWPKNYGIPGHPIPESYLQQLIYPFRKR